MWVEDSVEARYEHVLRDTSHQRLVDLGQYLPGRGGVQRMSGELKHATGCGHHQCCGNPLARCVPHHDSQPSVREKVEVVEVTSYLPSWPVEGRNLPALKFGHALGERGLLDAPRY